MKFTRQQIWRHNGLLGSTRMAYMAMETIKQVPTTTETSKKLADEIGYLLSVLEKSLRTRLDKE